MRYQPIGILRAEPEFGPTPRPLITTADFIEAKKSNFSDIGKRDLRISISKVLQKQAYMVHQLALTRFCLENPFAVEAIPKHFFKVTPSCFTPTPLEIELYMKEPKFLWRFSTNNYHFFVSCFTLNSSKTKLNDMVTFDKDDGLLVSYLLKPKKMNTIISKSKFSSTSNNSKYENFFDGKVADFLNKHFKSYIDEDQMVEHYFSDDYYLHELVGELDFVTFATFIITGQHNSVQTTLSIRCQYTSKSGIQKSLKKFQSAKIMTDIVNNKHETKNIFSRGIKTLKLSSKKSKLVRKFFNDDHVPLNFDVIEFNKKYHHIQSPKEASFYINQEAIEEKQLRVRNLIDIAAWQRKNSKNAFVPSPTPFAEYDWSFESGSCVETILTLNTFQRNYLFPNKEDHAFLLKPKQLVHTLPPTKNQNVTYYDISLGSINEEFFTASTSVEKNPVDSENVPDDSKETNEETSSIDIKQNNRVESENYSCVVQNEKKIEKNCVDCVNSIALSEQNSSKSNLELSTPSSADFKKGFSLSDSNEFEADIFVSTDSNNIDNEVTTQIDSCQSDPTLIDTQNETKIFTFSLDKVDDPKLESVKEWSNADSESDVSENDANPFEFLENLVEGPVTDLIKLLNEKFTDGVPNHVQFFKNLIKEESPLWNRSLCPVCLKIPVLVDFDFKHGVVISPGYKNESQKKLRCPSCTTHTILFTQSWNFAQDSDRMGKIAGFPHKVEMFVIAGKELKQYLVPCFEYEQKKNIMDVLVNFFFISLNRTFKDKIAIIRQEFAQQFVTQIPDRFHIDGVDFVQLFASNEKNVRSYLALHDDIVDHLDKVYDQMLPYRKSIPFIEYALSPDESKTFDIESQSIESSMMENDLIVFELIPFDLNEFIDTDEFKMQIANYLALYALKYHRERVVSKDAFINQRFLIQKTSLKHAKFVYACARDRHLCEVFYIVNHLKKIVHDVCELEELVPNLFDYDIFHHDILKDLDTKLTLENIRLNLEIFIGKYIDHESALQIFGKRLMRKFEERNGDYKAVICDDILKEAQFLLE